ncbi:hypothetical protein QUF74_17475 [Candidatus Halobeggiatoa sp. HSG11]|nr:hypothetical protein [Candidatus Halobeggiatoa sp. HSG11]
MKNYIFIIFISWLGTSHAISPNIADQLDIKAIKSINLIQTDKKFRAFIVVQFSSSAPIAMKFKRSNFMINFQDDRGADVFLGTTQPKEILFPASENNVASLTEKKLEVFVGENNINTINRLMNLFNLIGNPDSEFAMILSGTTEVGTKTKRGWLYQGQVEIEDFVFYPTIQREVLFK